MRIGPSIEDNQAIKPHLQLLEMTLMVSSAIRNPIQRTALTAIRNRAMPGVLVIGVGNEHRGDDAVGLIVARRLRDAVPDGVAIVEASGDCATLIESWAAADAVLLIDAVSSGGVPGAIQRLDGRAHPIPANSFRYSTHAFGVGEAVELARALGRLPGQIVIYGIEGKTFERGDALSVEVEEAAAIVADHVALEVLSIVQRDQDSLA
jgi:hydrogenase maturation protease